MTIAATLPSEVVMQTLFKTTIDLSQAVDHSSPIPFYFQLREYIIHLIQTGVLQTGDQVPTEMELCSITGLSRTVIRQAFQNLENDGYLERFRAKGTFVARPKVLEHLVQTLTGFYEDTVATGLIPRTQVLDFEIIRSPTRIARELRIPSGDPVIYLNRLRFIENEPIILVETYIPNHLCPNLLQVDLETHSLYQVLREKYNLYIVRANRSIEAVAARANEAKLLGIERNAPLLLLKSTGYLANDRPLEYFIARHRGDRAKFEVELVKTVNNSS
jgi:GntR family transcriptional regulator